MPAFNTGTHRRRKVLSGSHPEGSKPTLVEEPATKSTTDTQEASDSSNDVEMA